jgi:hypothetical protein
MKQYWGGVVAVLLGLALCGSARADYMNWSYHWALTDGPTFPSGFSNIAFALHPGATTGASTIPVGNFSSNSAATSPDSFNATYGLSLTITDNATKDQGTLNFHGLLSGALNASGSGVTNVIKDPSQNLTLDNHVYHVTLDSATGVAGPSDGIASINAHVSVTDLSGPKSASDPGSPLSANIQLSQQAARAAPAAAAPEPTALVLAGLGLTLCGVPCWRRRVTGPPQSA